MINIFTNHSLRNSLLQALVKNEVNITQIQNINQITMKNLEQPNIWFGNLFKDIKKPLNLYNSRKICENKFPRL